MSRPDIQLGAVSSQRRRWTWGTLAGASPHVYVSNFPPVRYNLSIVDAGSPRPLDGDERWELVKRIVASPHFKKSPRLQQFLSFIAERSLTGRSCEVTESTIGWEGFERTKDYDPSNDSIVRTAARQLPSKVKEYFDEEGSRETLILDIPKGGYLVALARGMFSMASTLQQRIQMLS